MRRSVIPALIFALILGLSTTGWAASIVFDLNPNGIFDGEATSLTLPVGNTFSAEVWITSPDLLSLSAVGVGIIFDPAQMQVMNVTQGIASPWDTFYYDPTSIPSGLIAIGPYQYITSGEPPAITPVTGYDILVGQVDFTCIAIGNRTVLLESALGGAFDGANPANPVTIDYFGQLQVSQVPIPGALWLLGSGLVGLVGLRRKRMLALK